MYATVLQVVQDAQPEFSRLVFSYPHAERILVTVQVDADDQVGSLVHNGPVLFDFEVNCIQEYDGVYALERSILPLLDQRENLIRHIGNKGG